LEWIIIGDFWLVLIWIVQKIQKSKFNWLEFLPEPFSFLSSIFRSTFSVQQSLFN
jgi:hypothetical protein